MTNKTSISVSFIKNMFCGYLSEDIVFPFPKLSEEEREYVNLITESIDKFAKKNIDSSKIDEEGKIPPEILNGLAEIGLFGITVPEEYGGSGLSQSVYSKVIEHLTKIDSSIAVTVGAHLTIGLKGIMIFGTDELKKKYLPSLASGEKIAAFALTEPGAGSDASSIRSHVKLSEDKNNYILNGNKIWITNGGIADVFTVFAQTDVNIKGEMKRKISAFIVTRDMEGFSSGQEERKMGIKGSSTTELSFDNVQIPKENLLGEEGKGFKVAMNILNSGRLGLAGGTIGGMHKLIDLAVEHAKTRKQFGKTISEFEMIQDKISRMLIETFVTESMVMMTAGLVDHGDIDYSVESAICKVYASEAGWRVVNQALQIAGGNGYMREYPYERLLRDSRINLIFEGTNEILRIFIALAGMQDEGEYLKKIGKALQDPIKSFGLLTDFAKSRLKDIIKTERMSKTVHSELRASLEMFENYAKEIHLTVNKALSTYGKEIIDQEFLHQRIADITIDLYAMITTISRVQSLIEEKGVEKVQTQIAICKTFCEEAWRRIRRNNSMVENNQDKFVKKIAESVFAN